ncbi:MAG: hypothetical protein M1825_001601 [Sarcosagium campestre]|nr:MAG: hypothetical protein M1825_001601 [Sarcosagium campestre]
MEIDDKQEALAMDNDRIASFDAFAFPPAPGRGRSATVTAGLGLAKRKNWVTRDELFTALLLPLPFLLVSYLFSPRSIFDREDVGDAGSPLDRTVLLPSQSSSGLPSAGLLEACAFTSAILLAVGILSKSGATKEFISTGGGGLGGKRDEKRYWPQMFSIQGGRRLAHRALSLVLPIYATMVLGGARVSMVLLCVVASSPVEGSPRHGAEGQTWKHLFNDHKATLAAVLLALGCDVLGIIAPIGPGALFVGYTSLALSASVIPLPFTKSFPASTLSTKSPSTSATSAVSSTPWEQQAPTLPLPVKNSNFSPARSIDDVDFTLVAGGILAGPSLIICIISEDCVITASFSQFCLLSSVVASAVLMLFVIAITTTKMITAPATATSTTMIMHPMHTTANPSKLVILD